MIKVGLIDKNELFRESLQFLIDYKTDLEVHFSSNDFHVLQNNVKPGMLDIVLVDIFGMHEIDKNVLKEAIHHFPETRFIVLTDSISNSLVREFISYRVAGFYSKSLNIVDLEKGVTDIYRSKSNIEIKFGVHIQQKLINREFFGENNQDKVKMFSERELEILNCVCQEMTNTEIAEKFGLSVRTIESHRRRMIERTESKTIIGVIVFALEHSVTLSNKSRSITNEISY